MKDIDILYELNKDKTVLTITLIEETEQGFSSKSRQFNLVDLDEEMLLYNNALDQFEAEYKGDIAKLIDKIIQKILKKRIEVEQNGNK